MEIIARAVGRRKEAVAQVQIVLGTGQFIINEKSAQEYLHNNSCSLMSIKAPFEILNSGENKDNIVDSNKPSFYFDKFDTIVKVKGGGLIGQAEAIKLGVARALCEMEGADLNLAETNLTTEVRKQLKTKGYLTQDSRVKERRKYGLKKARKASQYHKR
jgi:small subunit ribosomal protein S9